MCILRTKRSSPVQRPRLPRFESSTVVSWVVASAGRSPKKSRRSSSTWSTAAPRNTSTGSPQLTKAVPMSATQEDPIVQLQSSDLPAFCPNLQMPVWHHNPRVFIDVTKTGQAMCPYCGTVYVLKAGEIVKHHCARRLAHT